MIIKTKYFGDMEVTEEELIDFPEPMLGFEDSHKYIIIQFYDDSDSLLCLQSADKSDLALVLVNPHYVLEKYSPTLMPEDLKALNANEDTPLAFYNIAVVREDWKDSTINLRCPIAVNPKKMLGKQIIMEDTSYSMRHPLDFAAQEGA